VGVAAKTSCSFGLASVKLSARSANLCMPAPQPETFSTTLLFSEP
jgi:hypothetical protein